MNTTEILNGETPSRCLKHFAAVNLIKQLLVVSVGAFVAFCTTLSAHAQGTVYSVNIVGCVPDMTTYLLTARLTTAQRQALHAQNFNQLPASQRALYLHAVAYAVGLAVASDGFNQEQGTMLLQHLQSVSSIYDVPAIPPEYSQLLAAHLAAVKVVLQELNVDICDVIVNDSSFQKALYAGAVDSMWLSGDAHGNTSLR